MDPLHSRDKSRRRIFISYRREGGIDIARGLHDQLKQLGYSVFIDHEGLRAGAFNHALYQEIENSDVFLLVLSKGSLNRCRHKDDWVRQEIAHAIRCGKNIVPVMKEGFRFPSKLPGDIDQIRFCQALRISYDFYDAFLNKLEEYIWSTPVPLEQKPVKPSKKLPLLLFGLGVLVLVVAVMIGKGCGPVIDPTKPQPLPTTDTAASDALATDPTEADTEPTVPEPTEPSEPVLSGNSLTNLCNSAFIAMTHEGRANHFTSTDLRWYNLFPAYDTYYFYDAGQRWIKVQWGEDGKLLSVTLKENADCKYLYVTEDWLYCVLEEKGVDTLCRAENDPATHTVGQLKTVVSDILARNQVAVTADHIYYWAGDNSLFRCGLDGADPQLLFEPDDTAGISDPVTFHVSDAYVYFREPTGGIYAVSTRGGDAELLVDTRGRAAALTHAVECGGKLYYVMEYRSGNGPTAPFEIWCADMDGSNDRRVFTAESQDLEVLAVNSLGHDLYLQVRSGGRDLLLALYAGTGDLVQLHEYA